MKLLVLAQTPPPLHGQSQMVAHLVKGLPSRGIEIRHVNLLLSDTHDDIGRWRPAKALATVKSALAAKALNQRDPCDALYYVPAPGKRGAAWRDIAVMGILRKKLPRLILHWHATGLSQWTEGATFPERKLLHKALGKADLSIALADSLSVDAAYLESKRVRFVPNGIADPGDLAPRIANPRKRVLFLGQCSAPKGLFDAMAAVETVNAMGLSCELVVAGAFQTQEDRDTFRQQASRAAAQTVYLGEVHGERKEELLRTCDCLCFPTRYPHEGQPLVILEALAHGLPVVSTRWRAIPEILPHGLGLLSEPGDPNTLARNLFAVLNDPPSRAPLRDHFLRHYTLEKHLDRLAEAIRSL